jgi:hypothetical protein
MLALALFLLSPLAPAAVDRKLVEQEIRISHEWWWPEPLERFLYVTGVLLLPFCLGAAHLGIRRLRSSPTGQRLTRRLESPTAWLTAPLCLLLLFAAGLVDDREIVRTLTSGGAPSLLAAVLIALAATACTGSRLQKKLDLLLRVVLPILTGLLLLGILLFGVLGTEHIRDIPIFTASFNAVFHSVVQVFFGKQLLVDFVNQYGLYPHFLEPIFQLTGLSVFTFTAVMSLLNCLAFLCLYRFLAWETHDELLAFLGLTTILFFGYVAGRVTHPDLYLQYHPLRTLFPAVSLLAARAFAHHPTGRRCAVLFALGAAALLWNPDTGVILLAAGVLLVVYDALLRRQVPRLPVRLLLGLGAAAMTVLCFSVLLRLRFGAFPDYSRMFLHSKAFYLSGIGMLPMPRFGLWVPVALVYAAALLRSLVALMEGEDTPRVRLLFFLSVFGLGIFSYYQGRSVLGNLLMAGYPAVLILVLLASDLQRATGFRSRSADRLGSVVLLALLLYSVPALAAAAPAWVRSIATRAAAATAGKQENQVLKDARFLQRSVRPGQEIVILSLHSGVLHLLTQTTDPLDTPGQSELIFRDDFSKQYNHVIQRRGASAIDVREVSPETITVTKRIYGAFHEDPESVLVVFPAP